MKIYILFENEIEWTDKTRRVAKFKQTHTVEVHRTFDGARKAATEFGFNMSNLQGKELGHGIISWPGYVKEQGLRDKWMEIVEDTLMD